jgi:hypothetical protein
MMRRGRLMLALVVGIAVAAAFTLAYAKTEMPEKDITIESKDVFKTMKKGPVIFSHAKHKELQCTQCHHEYKEGKNVWKKGQEVKKCETCHKLETEGKKVKLQLAFHNTCVKCHKKLKAEKKKTGPTSCAKCHQKKVEKPEEKK